MIGKLQNPEYVFYINSVNSPMYDSQNVAKKRWKIIKMCFFLRTFFKPIFRPEK